MSTIALHSTLNISETVRDRGLVPKDHQIGNGLCSIKWSRDHVVIIEMKIKRSNS